MIRRSFAIAATSALAVGLMGPVASAAPGSGPDAVDQPLKKATATESRVLEKGPVVSLGEGKGRELYVIQLDEAAVPSYTGGVKGLDAVRADGRTYRTDGAPERAYRQQIATEQRALRGEIAEVTGRSATPTYTYTEALNGFALELTRDEAAQVADLEGVSAVQVDVERQLQTDRGPEWIGAPSIWDGSATPSGEGNKGEGIVAGIIDSGINPANPSFADSVSEADGGDGYDHTNPLGAGNYVGVCDPDSDVFIADWGCNDKLIGAWDFAPDDGTNPYDENGHGTHTGSTTAGNQVEATTYSSEAEESERFSATRTIKGVAPHANVIAYDVCSGGCPGSAILAGIDQAIADEVDVINYSIGANAPSNPWSDADALGFLNARAAGIHVATSAGNSGPGAATVGAPADVPWITSVGATQHDRQWRATVEDLTADGGATHPDIEGLAFANATDGSFPIVDAAELEAPLCQADDLTAAQVEGKIVVCDRGGNGRVEKGQVLAELGAAGMILANDEPSGDSLNADPHALPAVHITYDDGVELRAWMATVEGEQASLSGGQEYIGDDVADIMAGFSSRGPNSAIELISPSISAPGVDILAAEGVDNEVKWGFISGTSMASPHVAGALALVAAEHPDWTPAQAQSALMTTAVTEITDNDGTPADWYDMGSGRVDLTKAADAGLVLDATEDEYLAADPAAGGDVTALNTASMAEFDCLQTCTWTRTVEATDTGAGTWTAEGSSVTDGIDVTIEPASFELAAGETQEITITADVSGSSVEDFQFGNVTLTPAEGSDAPAAHLPVAAKPSNGALPESIEIDTRRDAGSAESDPIEAVEITALDVQANGLVPAQSEELSVEEDTTNDDPFDGNGTVTETITVPEGATRLIVNLQNATAPDFDLFVGKGTEPSAATQVASSASGGSAESIDLGLGEGDEGPWWILVQNWEASESGTDTVDLETAVVAGDEGNLTAEGPATNPLGEPFTVRAFWDEDAMEAGQTWYGSISLATADGGTAIGSIPVTINRVADDVTKTVDKASAKAGDTLTYTVDVQPNVTDEEIVYTFEDTLPAGTTYVEGSGPEGATFEDGVLSWTATMPTAAGAPGDYDVTTSATDESCVHPFTGTAEYVDLFEVGGDFRDPSITGDGTAWTAFSSLDFPFYEESQQGLTFTDDGFLVYDGATNYGGETGTPQALPDPALPNNLAAMLWQDMTVTYDESTNAGVSLATAGDLALVQFDDLRRADDPEGTQGLYDMQVAQVAGSRDVVVAYGDVTGPVDNVTIGVEDAAGERGTALVSAGDASDVIAPNTVVCMTYGVDLEPAQFTYEVTVDEGVRNGTLVNSLVHTTDDPGAKPVTVERAVTVGGEVVEPPAPGKTPVVNVIAKRNAVEPRTNGLVVFRRPASAKGERLVVNYKVRGSAKQGRDIRFMDRKAVFAKGATTAREVVRVVDRKGRQGPRMARIIVVKGAGYDVGPKRTAKVKVLERRGR